VASVTPTTTTVAPTEATAATEQPIVVATVCDDNYVTGLAVMVRSLLENLRDEPPIVLHVIGAIGEENRRRLTSSWPYERLTVHWANPDVSEFTDLPVLHKLNHTTYLRLRLPELVPGDRVLFIDADILVRRDVRELWDADFGEHPIVGVKDLSMPTADRAVERWEPLGLDADQPYINAGLMLIDLAAWRTEDWSPTVVRYVREHRPEFCEQEAFNVVLGRRIGLFDPRWNALHEAFAKSRIAGLDPREHERLRLAPWLVHFTGPLKPWHWGCDHPFAAEWRRYLDNTDYRDYKPVAPPLWKRTRTAVLDAIPGGRATMQRLRRRMRR
jgi:lipopolysaccharide biosynthesis glycosyltransferase